MSATAEALIAEYASAPTPPSPPPSPLSPLSSPLPQIPSPSLPLPSPPTTSPIYVEAPLGYRAAGIWSGRVQQLLMLDSRYWMLLQVDATPGCIVSGEVGYRIEDVWDDMITKDSSCDIGGSDFITTDIVDYSSCTYSDTGGLLSFMGNSQKMPPKRTTTPMSDVAIKALVARSVADALAEHEANRSINGDDSHDSGTGSRRTKRTTRE
ncbi:hypothetical protein Tco_1071878 [Tanacetum coccineum]